jgi:hypothetical protein
MPFNPLVVAEILLGILALTFLVLSIAAFRKRKVIGAVLSVLLTLLMLSLASLVGVIGLSLQGYRALTKEELAADVKVEPAGAQRFTARFSFPDGRERVFSLAGDQFYVDAHVLKWKPIANILGLHTVYELDRVAGRYENIQDETSKPRTVFSLSADRRVDLYELRRRYTILSPLVDAEYGSATFINSNTAEEYHIMVSTTGLLIRTVGK